MMRKIDNPLNRWSNISIPEQRVWDYFNEVIAKNSIHEAMNEKSITLTSLYQKLALIRAECEWIKRYISRNNMIPFTRETIDELRTNTGIKYLM
jgi:molecular chaperone DnaK (HSP70)